MPHQIVMTPERTDTAAAQSVRTLLQHRGSRAVALALAALVALLGGLARPTPPSLSTLVTGDAVLTARARPLLPGHLDRVSIAVVDRPSTTYAGFGANERTAYEIGSLTKTFTVALLADAIGRGEVTADAKVGALLPLGDAPVADVTLAELASHRAGLSTHGMQPHDALPFMLRLLSHHDPFVHDVDCVLPITRRATLTNRGSVVYSNLGVAVLGHALAAAAQMDYVQLVQERLFTPLGMAASSLPVTAENLPRGAPRGYSAAGVAEAPWTTNGWAPAGGVSSTAADLARYVRALLDGTAPGMDALTPRWEVGAQQIGYVWVTQEYQGHTVTVKNGLTGGFTSTIILDRANRRAVIMLSNTAAAVDDAAYTLLVGDQAWTSSR